MLIEALPQPGILRDAVAPLTSLMHRSMEVCSAEGCRRRLPAWSGFWGGNHGCFANSDWFCSFGCMEKGIAEAIEIGRAQLHSRPAVVNRMPLGLMLMGRGVITHEQLKAALAARGTSTLRIGQVLMQNFGVEEEAITQSIAGQSSCAVFRAKAVQESLLHSVPLELVERFGMVPVHISQNRKNLYVGFNGLIDRGILYALEMMLGCHTEPCILSDSTFQALLEKIRGRGADRTGMKGFSTSEEIASMICSRALKTRDACVRFTTCGDSIWTRIAGSEKTIDLLFARYPDVCHTAGNLKSSIAAADEDHG